MAKRTNNRSEVRKFLEDVSICVNGCWQWIGDTNRTSLGYGCFYHNAKRILAHRYMWELVNDKPVPTGFVVMHTCDNSLCVNPDHLKLGTQGENVADMITKDRQRFPKAGWGHPLRKTNPELVREARKLRRNGHKISEIANILGLGVSTVGHMVNTHSRYIPEKEQWNEHRRNAQAE